MIGAPAKLKLCVALFDAAARGTEVALALPLLPPDADDVANTAAEPDVAEESAAGVEMPFFSSMTATGTPEVEASGLRREIPPSAPAMVLSGAAALDWSLTADVVDTGEVTPTTPEPGFVAEAKAGMAVGGFTITATMSPDITSDLRKEQK